MATELGDDLVSVNDFETGGLDEHEHDIIGYGSIIVDPYTLEEVRAVELKARPVRVPSEGARAVNGYSSEAWRDALTQHDALVQYREFLGGVRQFASWNPWFDRRFLVATARRLNVPVELDYHNIDIVGMFREAVWARGTRLEKFSLDHAALALGLEPEPKPHLPLQGARKVLEVWRAIRCLQ